MEHVYGQSAQEVGAVVPKVDLTPLPPPFFCDEKWTFADFFLGGGTPRIQSQRLYPQFQPKDYIALTHPDCTYKFYIALTWRISNPSQ